MVRRSRAGIVVISAIWPTEDFAEGEIASGILPVVDQQAGHTVARQLTVVDPEKEDNLADVSIYSDLLKSAIETRAAAEDRFLDVHYKDVVRDPLGSVRRIYEHFGLEFTEELNRRAQKWLADHPRGKHGEHRYTLEQFGLTRDYLHERLAFYSERFQVAPEAA